MSRDNSKIKQELSFVTITNLLEKGMTALFWFLLIPIVTKTEYGEISFLLSTAVFGFGLASMGLRKLIIVFESKNEPVFFPAFIFGLLTSTVVGLGAYFYTQNHFVSVLIFCIMTFELTVSYFLSKDNYKNFSIFSILRRLLSLIISLILFQFMGVDGVIIGFILSTVIGFYGFYILKNEIHNSFSVLKQKATFLSQNYSITLIDSFSTSGINIIIGSLFGFVILANYTVSFQFLLAINTIPSILSVYLLPKESRGVSNKKLKIYSIILSVIVAILSIVLIPFLVPALIPEYSDIIFPLQIISISIIPTIFSTIIETSFLGSGNVKPVLISNSSQFVTMLSLTILLGSTMGLLGIVIAWLFSQIVQVCIAGTFYKLSLSK